MTAQIIGSFGFRIGSFAGLALLMTALYAGSPFLGWSGVVLIGLATAFGSITRLVERDPTRCARLALAYAGTPGRTHSAEHPEGGNQALDSAAWICIVGIAAFLLTLLYCIQFMTGSW